jgi:hypothetical protein
MDAFTITNGIQLAGLLLAGATSLLTVWWRIEVRVRGIEDAAIEKTARMERELQDFKLNVAENYASWDTVKEIEARLAKGIENVSNQVTHLPDILVDRVMKFMSMKVN